MNLTNRSFIEQPTKAQMLRQRNFKHGLTHIVFSTKYRHTVIKSFQIAKRFKFNQSIKS